MKELYFFDETFYWGRSGRRATVIEAECELTQSVRPDELRAAVVSALRVHRNFRARRRHHLHHHCPSDESTGKSLSKYTH